ncbi:DUF4832 domain-containing protein [Microbacterium sp. 1P10UB]|uniref:DUF4832 domain-containing protein n=1 Tax=unclassified Microbacterium TaxID=2609290 RepID=UPI0039A1F90B
MRKDARRRGSVALIALGAGVALAATAFVPANAATDESVVTYEEDTSVITNPARGFYAHTETHSRADGSGWTPLDGAALTALRDEGISQILRVVYLERYVDADLDQAVLDAVDADLATARAAGISVILRFAYVQGGDWPYSPPYGDATPERVRAHIAQLTPVLRDNADVIAVMQQGFVGLWGEGYYTDHFVADPANPGVVTDADWAERTSVVDALLEALPESRMVQVRTMLSKQEAFDRPSGVEGALTDDEGFDGSDVARVGHHNDCFLASPDDYGTFLTDPLSLDQDYLAQETRYVPMGGETCAVNPPRSEWESASSEMARYHFSYLNRDYNRDVLGSWGQDNLDEVARRLGYRFVLESSRVTGGDDPSISIDLRNGGWASPYNPRPVTVVLEGDDQTITVALPQDARTWAPGEEVTLDVPLEGVPDGEYRVHLALPAPEATVAADPRYAIRTANLGTWEAETGWNDLGRTLEVGTAAVEPSPTPTVTAEPTAEPTTEPTAAPATQPTATPSVSATAAASTGRGTGGQRLATTGSDAPIAAGLVSAGLLLAGAGALLLHRRRRATR